MKGVGMKEADQTLTPVRANIVSRLLHSQELGIVAALVITMVALTAFAPGFSSSENILNDARNLSFLGIVVLGETMVMITGGIDLSVGSVWGMAAVTSAALMAAALPSSAFSMASASPRYACHPLSRRWPP